MSEDVRDMGNAVNDPAAEKLHTVMAHATDHLTGVRIDPKRLRRAQRRRRWQEGGAIAGVLSVALIAAGIAVGTGGKQIGDTTSADRSAGAVPVPNLVGQKASDLTGFLAQPANGAGKFTLGGEGTDCGTTGVERTGTKGTVVAQNPQNGILEKPGPITYCIAQGPKLATVAAGLKGQSQAAVTAVLKQAGFKTDNMPVADMPNSKIPAGGVLDITDAATGRSVLGLSGLDVSQVDLSLTVSVGQLQISLQTDGLLGLDINAATAQLKRLGFTNVQTGVDQRATPSQIPTLVTKVSVPDGRYAANQPITLYYAPQAAATTPPTTQ